MQDSGAAAVRVNPETRLVLCDLFGLVVLLLGRHRCCKVEQSTSAFRSKGGGEKLKGSSYEIRAAVCVLP